MRTLLVIIFTMLMQTAWAGLHPDMIKLNGRRHTVKESDVRLYEIGVGANIGRVFIEMKGKRFRNSYVQLIVNNQVIKNFAVYKGRMQNFQAFVGQYAQGVVLRVVSGKVKVKSVMVELNNGDYRGGSHHGGSVILPVHADADLLYLLEELRMNINNIKGFVSFDDMVAFNDISKLALKAISTMSVRGDSFDEGLAEVADLLREMDKVAPIVNGMMEREQISYLAVNFLSIQEGIRMLTTK